MASLGATCSHLLIPGERSFSLSCLIEELSPSCNSLHIDTKDNAYNQGTPLQRLVIALWVSTTLAGVFLLAEFILKFEHVRFRHLS